jgi:exopolysaccharide biosynthesis polyprenyl glycosylphosphotransferase
MPAQAGGMTAPMPELDAGLDAGAAGDLVIVDHSGTRGEGSRDQGVVASARVRHAVIKGVLPGVDLLAGAAAMTVMAIPAGHRLTPATILTLPALVLFAYVGGLYERDQHLLRKSTLEEAPRLFQVAGLYSLLTWMLAGPLGLELGSVQAGAMWALLCGFMLMGRAVGRAAVRRIRAPERCLVVGDARSAVALQRKLALSFSVKATVVGHVPFDEPPADSRSGVVLPPVLGSVNRLAETIIAHHIERVIVVPDKSDDGLDAIRLGKTLGVPISVLPRMLEVIGSSFEFDDVDGLGLLGLRSCDLTRSIRIRKRSLDVTLVGLGLLLLAPAFAVIAVAIKLTSPGPVLYRQRRIGRDGRPFMMLKFRSMVHGADAQKAHLLDLNETQGLFKIAKDPRTTPLGRFLRRSSLDELPQLWNVMRGEMSLVGPRPLVPEDDANIEGWERARLDLTPGITGPWQILGSTRTPLEEMVRLDYRYRACWSMWLEVKIMLRTLIYMAGRRGT